MEMEKNLLKNFKKHLTNFQKCDIIIIEIKKRGKHNERLECNN